ncbi:MAG: M20 family metallopeptidase [Chloroflexota bacterium]|nr:M20 family metallopeptidase [Chloroflexota bacterium]
MTGADVAASVRAGLEPRRQEMVDLLGRLVRTESPSDDRPGLDRFADQLEALFGDLGPIQQIEAATAERGRHLRLSIAGTDDGAHAVALCHYDTVWSTGTLQRIPFSVDANGVARGPGCFDMKGGIVVLYFALHALRDRGLRPRRRLEILFTSDEEVGSPSSRSLIERTARGAAVAYVLESPLPGGTLKTARKGTGDYFVRIAGRAAHAGVEPQKGISATQELAHQVLALHALNDYASGTTVNVGVVRAGTRPNVVAAEAEAQVDVRVQTLAEAARIDAAIRGLKPQLPGASLDIDGGLNRPPMERSPAMAALFERAKEVAASMGVGDLQEGSTGGGSDGNFTAAMGVPTLDGLGPEGEGAHAAHEHVLTDSFPRRAALVAALVASV